MAGNQRAVDSAKHTAAMYRRAGYSQARAVPEYCVDELGEDGFYTFTVSVYVGAEDKKTMSPLWRRLTKTTPA
jgi:hypothetical protein